MSLPNSVPELQEKLARLQKAYKDLIEINNALRKEVDEMSLNFKPLKEENKALKMTIKRAKYILGESDQ